MSIKNSTLAVATLILIGRITGFGREWLLSSILGANEKTDVAVILFTFPDLIVSLFLGGGLSTSLIPYLRSVENQKKKSLIRQLSIFVGLIFFFIALLFAINLETIWNFLAPGLGPEIKQESNNYFLIIIFSIPITAITGVLTSYLNSKSKFKVAASGTILFNSGIIFGLILNIPIFWRITIGVIFGSFLRFFAQNSFVKLFKGTGLKNFLNENLITKVFIKSFFFNFTFITSITLMPAIGKAWASTINEGDLTLFSYSNKLIELPIGIVVGSLTTVLLTKLTNDSSISNIVRSIRLVTIITLFIAIPSFLLTPLIVKTVYFKGQFDNFQLDQLIALTRIGYLFLLPQVLVTLFSTIFASKNKQKVLWPVGILMVTLVNFFAYNLSLSGDLVSIAYANGITYLIISIVLYILLNVFVDKRIHEYLITF